MRSGLIPIVTSYPSWSLCLETGPMKNYQFSRKKFIEFLNHESAPKVVNLGTLRFCDFTRSICSVTAAGASNATPQTSPPQRGCPQLIVNHPEPFFLLIFMEIHRKIFSSIFVPEPEDTIQFRLKCRGSPCFLHREQREGKYFVFLW